MKKRILSIFLCSLILTSGVCGCRKDKSTKDTSQSSSSVEKTDFKTMEPPVDGWTNQEFFDISYICGKKINLPATLDSLGSNFEFDKKSIEVNEEKQYAKADVLYKGDFLGKVRIDNVDNIDDINKNTPLTSLLIDSNLCEVKSCTPVVINGLTFGDSYDSILETMGNSFEDKNGICDFKDVKSERIVCKLSIKNEVIDIIILNFN